jgi:hypothetical protein
MLRATQALILVICLVIETYAEDTAPLQSWNVVAIVPARPMRRPPEAIQVEEPYCEYGVGPCGGSCNEEAGKHWDCGKNTMPCYQSGQRCKCEEADMCRPQEPPKLLRKRRKKKKR